MHDDIELTDEELEMVLAYRAKNMPEIVEFYHYLHGDSDDLKETLEDATSMNFSSDLWKKIYHHRPFYEVRLTCELNTRTGEIEIKKVIG